MVQNSVTKPLGLALCTVEFGLGSERLTRANPHFFINAILNSGTAKIFQFLHFFIRKIANNLAFFCSFCKIFTLYDSRKNVCKITANQTSTVPHNCKQISCAAKRLFRGFVFFGRQNERH